MRNDKTNMAIPAVQYIEQNPVRSISVFKAIMGEEADLLLKCAYRKESLSRGYDLYA
jgi:hypothetical protein